MAFAIDLNLNPSNRTADYDTPVKARELPTDFYNHDDDDVEEEEEEDCSFEKEVDDDSVGDLGRISNENRKLKEMLTIIWDHNSSLRTQVNKLTQDKENPKKRKLNDETSSSTTLRQSSWNVSPKNDHQHVSNTGIQRVYVKTDPSDKTLVVKDGYQWRKYGQKVTRDNPSPRAYYKCSFAPTCPVKKKVQRSVDDAGVVVVTYEGEHNHRSSKQDATYALANQYSIFTTSTNQLLVQQITDCLTKDPNFTQQLATTISSRILDFDL